VRFPVRFTLSTTPPPTEPTRTHTTFNAPAGVVYEAAAPDGSLVALKLLLNRCGPHASLDDVLLVENEAAALSELQHPHIAQLLNTVRLANGTLLVMELARGGDLRTFLEQQRGGLLSPLLARDFVKQLARGIRHAHNLKIIHRDLKLDNVLLDASQTQLRIADFGLSHAAKGEARLGAAGSLYYMVRRLGKPRQGVRSRARHSSPTPSLLTHLPLPRAPPLPPSHTHTAGAGVFYTHRAGWRGG